MTDTMYEDKLIYKLTFFNFINSYFALFFAIFINRNCGTAVGSSEGDNDACFKDLRFSLATIFITAIASANLQSFFVPYAKLYWNMYKEGGLQVDGDVAQMSAPGIQYLLVECDEAMDNIKAYTVQATQYGYITLFSAAFPLAPLLALLNNMLQMRTDGFKYLCTYRRIQPSGAEDIGSYQAVFEGLNVVGAVSSAATLVYRTGIILGGETTAHKKDAVFMLTVTVFLALITIVKLVVDDVPYDVQLQINRQEFIKSKIIDAVADEEEVTSFKSEAVDTTLLDKDYMEPYSTYNATFRAKRATALEAHNRLPSA
jgi:hypothetical protein